MTLTYDLYWSFRSPYSYLITHKLVELERDYDVRGQIRPVYPLAVRTPEFFDGRDPLWYSYLQADIRREAEFLGLPIRWPRPDPVRMDMATRTYPKDQPYIHRLTRTGVAAAERGRGLAFLDQASRLIWSGDVDNWQEGDHLADAARRAGLDPVELMACVDNQAERLNAVIEASQVAQRAAGHYGVPMIAFNGEAFFGQDRFDQFKWRLRQQGLMRRTDQRDREQKASAPGAAAPWKSYLAFAVVALISGILGVATLLGYVADSKVGHAPGFPPGWTCTTYGVGGAQVCEPPMPGQPDGRSGSQARS